MNTLKKTQVYDPVKAQPEYTQLETYYDEKYRLIWCYMQARPQLCFSPTLLSELKGFRDSLIAEIDAPEGRELRYMVLASKVPGVFNLGGDLELFGKLITEQDRAGLLNYAKTCIEILYANLSHFDRDITTITLVQGDALGGGLEGAMSSKVLIAERSAKMGLPEIRFNLFPGMGAYSILSRRLDPARAERMMLSGRIYTAEELYEKGVVDVLAEDGQGEQAVYDYVRREDRSRNGFAAVRQIRCMDNPITIDELMGIAEIWIDAALRLQSRDLRIMRRLVSKQLAGHWGVA